MIRILHLSDLHFGRDRPELEEPLIEAVNRIAPDLVVISGDFTQRARRAQFARARAFLDRIEPPTLSVPGNHDTPLDNLFMRFLRPFHRYRKFIDRNLEPVLETGGMVVAGVNTVNRFSWQRGRMSPRTIRRLSAAFSGTDAWLKVAVLHHPLEHGPEVEKRLMRGAHDTLTALRTSGAEMVLSGHLHNTVTRPFAISPGCLFVQAGTGLSNRLRGEDNTFNLISCTPSRVEIETWAAGERPAFAPHQTTVFTREGDGSHWTKS